MINKINELIDFYKLQYNDIIIQEHELHTIIKNINTDKALSCDKEYHKLLLKSYDLIIENKYICSKNIYNLIKDLDYLIRLIDENTYLENKIKNL